MRISRGTSILYGGARFMLIISVPELDPPTGKWSEVSRLLECVGGQESSEIPTQDPDLGHRHWGDGGHSRIERMLCALTA